VEAAILEEIAKVQTAGVTQAEVDRDQQQTLAWLAFRRDGTFRIASELNEWIAVGDWTLYQRFPEELAKVTPADVQRVAQTYLNEDQSTTGWFVPVGEQK
jgi:zinc protease